MNEVIRVKNISYDRYEELLLKRDALKKEAFQYEQAYIREFGGLILEVFELKLECIRKKKTIEYCQAAANHGKTIDQAQLQEYLQREMAEFRKQLAQMVQEKEDAEGNGLVTETDMLEIKRIYRRIAKQIHPDINPETLQSPELQELWQRTAAAYKCNDLKTLRETEILVSKALEQLQKGTIDIEIPDIDKKIAELAAEIEKIRSTDPYKYIDLLENPELISEKKAELEEEKKSYEDYSRELEEILKTLLENGVSITWRMN